jgi:hypothetical protein
LMVAAIHHWPINQWSSNSQPPSMHSKYSSSYNFCFWTLDTSIVKKGWFWTIFHYPCARDCNATHVWKKEKDLLRYGDGRRYKRDGWVEVNAAKETQKCAQRWSERGVLEESMNQSERKAHDTKGWWQLTLVLNSNQHQFCFKI